MIPVLWHCKVMVFGAVIAAGLVVVSCTADGPTSPSSRAMELDDPSRTSTLTLSPAPTPTLAQAPTSTTILTPAVNPTPTVTLEPSTSTATPPPTRSARSARTPSIPAGLEDAMELAEAASLTTAQLVAATRHPVWKVRWDAVNELGLREDPDGIAALAERALYDDNSHPRWRSLWAISAIDRQATQAIPEFISALEDTDPVVVRNAAIALAFFHHEEARPELLNSLEDPDSFRRWEAVFSLNNVGSDEVIMALLPRLDESVEPNTRVRSQVALTLGQIGGPELVPALLGTLKNDPEPGVRMRAVLSLGRTGGPAALEGLRAALAVEPDTTVRDALKNAIDNST